MPVSKFISKVRAGIQVALAVAMVGGSPAMAQVAAPAPSMPSMAMPAMPGHTGHDDNLVPKTPTLLAGYGQGGFSVTTASPARSNRLPRFCCIIQSIVHLQPTRATTACALLNFDRRQALPASVASDGSVWAR